MSLTKRSQGTIFRLGYPRVITRSPFHLEPQLSGGEPVLLLSSREAIPEPWPSSAPASPSAALDTLTLTALLIAQDMSNDPLPMLRYCWRHRALSFANPRTTAALAGTRFTLSLGADLIVEMAWGEEVLSLAYARALLLAGRYMDAIEVLKHIPQTEISILPYCEAYEALADWSTLESLTRSPGLFGEELRPAVMAYRAQALYWLGDFAAGQVLQQSLFQDATESVRHKAIADYAQACERQGSSALQGAAWSRLRADNAGCWRLPQ